MGTAPTNETGKLHAKDGEGKDLTIEAEFCASWGYSGIVGQFKSFFLNKLSDIGYNVNYTLIPKQGIKGEYFVYKLEGEKRKIIFSNNKKVHENDNPVFGNQINEENFDSVLKKLEEN